MDWDILRYKSVQSPAETHHFQWLTNRLNFSFFFQNKMQMFPRRYGDHETIPSSRLTSSICKGHVTNINPLWCETKVILSMPYQSAIVLCMKSRISLLGLRCRVPRRVYDVRTTNEHSIKLMIYRLGNEMQRVVHGCMNELCILVTFAPRSMNGSDSFKSLFLSNSLSQNQKIIKNWTKSCHFSNC